MKISETESSVASAMFFFSNLRFHTLPICLEGKRQELLKGRLLVFLALLLDKAIIFLRCVPASLYHSDTSPEITAHNVQKISNQPVLLNTASIFYYLGLIARSLFRLKVPCTMGYYQSARVTASWALK